MNFYALVGLGGIILSRTLMTSIHANRCNKTLPKNMQWEQYGAPIIIPTTSAQKAWATRRAASSQAVR